MGLCVGTGGQQSGVLLSRKPKGKGLQFHSPLQDVTPSDLRTSGRLCHLPHMGLWGVCPDNGSSVHPVLHSPLAPGNASSSVACVGVWAAHWAFAQNVPFPHPCNVRVSIQLPHKPCTGSVQSTWLRDRVSQSGARRSPKM